VTTAQPFPYKTEPFYPEQREIFRASWHLPYAFLSCVPGTGKTWISINSAAALYLKDKIDAMIVLAPKGVHTAWAVEQLPQHMPDVVPWRAHVWISGKERSLAKKRIKAGQRTTDKNWEILALAKDKTIFPILCVNSEALGVALCRKAIGTFLTQRRCLMVVDESGDFTTPSANRTRALMLWRMRAPYRRCLDGTPVGGDPFDLYAPYKFLHPSVLGYRTLREMEDAHAEWDYFERSGQADHDGNVLRKGREFRVQRVINGKKVYKDLDVLAKKIAPVTFRVTKDVLGLPPKRFKKRFFDLSDEQWRLTKELAAADMATLQDGNTVTVTNVLTRYLRYQQIACGYVPPDIVYGEEVEPISIIPGPNPRLDMAVDTVLRYNGRPAIVWTRFQYDIDLLAPRLRAEGLSVVTYDGRTTNAQREEAVRYFQAGEVNVFLGNPAAGGRGLNLQRAEFELFYANYFGLRRRLQAEDRGHRIGTTTSVLITDLVGKSSIDLTIVRALRNGMDVANAITGDPVKDWI
jgi:hypothetical protein